MIVVLCTRCMHGLQVIGDEDQINLLVGEQSDFWPNNYPCPFCEGKADGAYERDVHPPDLQRFTLTTVDGGEAFAALMGAGLPEQKPASKQAVLESLQTGVKAVHGSYAPARAAFLLDRIELTDGSMIHFAGGPTGAVIYKIVPAQPYKRNVT